MGLRVHHKKVTIDNGIDNPIPVDIIEDGSRGDVKNIYDNAPSLAKNQEVQLVKYLVPAGKTFYLKEIEFSGENRAKYEIQIQTLTEGVKRTWDNKLNGSFLFYNLKLVAGTLIDLRVIHQRPQVGDFDARIIGNEV